MKDTRLFALAVVLIAIALTSQFLVCATATRAQVPPSQPHGSIVTDADVTHNGQPNGPQTLQWQLLGPSERCRLYRSWGIQKHRRG
jgi:hypothetical protein